MIDSNSISIYGKLLSKVYKTPDTEKVKLHGPEPYPVEIEETFLERNIIEEEKRVRVKVSNIATVVSGVLFIASGGLTGFLQYYFLHKNVASYSSLVFSILVCLTVLLGTAVGFAFILLKPRESRYKTDVIQVEKPKESKRKISVEISEDDYPEKRISVSDVKKEDKTKEIEVDDGPEPYYLIYSILLWIIAAAGAGYFLYRSKDAMHIEATYYILPFELIVTTAGFIVYWVIKGKFRKTALIKKQYVDFQEIKTEKMIKVDENYAPKYVDQIIPNNERITGLYKVDFDFEAVPVKEGVLVVDGESITGGEDVTVYTIDKGAEIQSVNEDLTVSGENIPAVLSSTPGTSCPTSISTTFGTQVSLRGEETDLLNLFYEIGNYYADHKEERLRTNLLRNDSSLLSRLEVCAGDENKLTSKNQDCQRLFEVLDHFEEYNIVSVAENFISEWGKNNAILSGVRFDSLHNGVSPAILKFGHVSHYASFNFYCPYCNAEKIAMLTDRDYSVSNDSENEPIGFSKNSRCHYDIDEDTWYCKACERSVKHPIPMHKVIDETLYPVYDRLIEENKPARFDLDNKTRDDELAYTNEMDKEVNQFLLDLSSEKFKITSEIEMVEANIEGHNKAIESIRGIIGDYQLKQTKVMQRISDKNSALVQKIKEDNQLVVKNLEEKKAELIREYEAAMDKLAVSKKLEDMARDQRQVEILDNIRSIKESSSRTADATESTAISSAQTAESTARIAVSSEKTAEATSRTAEGVENLGQKMDKMNETMEQGNAINTAVAKKQGIDLNQHAWYRVDKNVPAFFAGISGNLMGESETKKAKRIGRAVE